MGLCIKCKYHKSKKNCSDRTLNEHSDFALRGHYCINKKNARQDFVTGEIFNVSCYQKNAFGECLFFEELTEDTDDTQNHSDSQDSQDI